MMLNQKRSDFRKRRATFLAVATATVVIGYPCVPAMAVTSAWNSGTSDVWSNSARWTAGIPTAASDIANLTLNITATTTVTIDGAVASRTVGTLNIGDITTTSNSFALAASGGGTLTFDNGASNAVLTQNSTSNGDTISAPFILNNALDITNASAGSTLTVSSPITAGNAGTKVITIGGTAAGAITLSGVIGAGSGNVSIVKGNSANTLTLSGASTFSGGVTLNAGTLNLTNASALGTGALTITGGTLNGSITLAAANANAKFWNGDFAFGGTSSLNLGTGAVTLGASRTVTISGSGTYTAQNIGEATAGSILTTANGTAGLATGFFAIDGTSTYTGGTNINGGVVRFASGAAIPTDGVVSIGSTGALSVSGAHATLAGWLGNTKLSSTSTGALSLAGATSAEAFNPGAAGFNTLSLGSNVGNSATYTGSYTPANDVYYVGGGGGTITFSNTNAFTGARTLVAGNGGGGTVIISGNNDYSGTTSIAAASTLQVGTGGTVGSLGTTPNITNNGTLTFNRSDNLTLGIVVSGTGRIVKSGTGTLAVAIAQTNTGTNAINNGTLYAGVNNALAPTAGLSLGAGSANGANSTAGNLDLSDFSQTVASLTTLSSNTANTNTVTIGNGKTLTVTGNVTFGQQALGVTNKNVFTGAGTLALTGTGSTMNIGLQTSTTANQSPVNATTVDLAGLGSFTANIATFNVGAAQQSGSTLNLSNTSNDITATTLTVANSAGNNGVDSAMRLGAGTNTIKATTFNIGISKVAGTVSFASSAAGSPGTVSITGKTGGASTVDMTIGSKGTTSTGADFDALLDLRGHQSTVQAGTVVVGQDSSTSSTNEVTGTISFDTGSFTVNSLTLGNKSSSASAIASGTLNLGGGNFTINTGGTFRLANRGGSAGTANGTVNLTGGTLTSNVDLVEGGQANSNSTLTINGGTLDMKLRNIGTAAAPIDALNLQSGTLQNVLQINGGTAITKTTGGVLTLTGTNTYTGSTTVAGGTLLANSASATGTGSVIVNSTATLGGTGSIAGPITINPGGNLSPGASIGQLTADSPVTFASGAGSAPTLTIELQSSTNSSSTDDSDVLALTGSGANGVLTLTNPDALNILPLSAITTPTTFTIATFDASSPLTNVFENVYVDGIAAQNGVIGGDNYVSVAYNATNIQITVNNLSAVPEPASIGLLTFGAAGLLSRRRRGQKRFQ